MALTSIKREIKKKIPKNIWAVLLHFYLIFFFRFVEWRYKRIAKKVAKKSNVKAVFLVLHESIWKYDGVYKLMEKDPRFDPIVVICPYISDDEETMVSDMDRAYKDFFAKGYNVVKSYNQETKTWLDVKKELKPDIVLFTSPYKVKKDEYFVLNFLRCLTVYVPYGIMMANIQQKQYNMAFHSLVWRCYYETPVHKEMAIKYASNKGRNVVVTGYPMCDIFLDKNYHPGDNWKIKNTKLKRIIWAPHHTFEENDNELAYSNFLSCHQYMLDLANSYRDKIQIAFKPHQNLKFRLYAHPGWGKEKTDDYYQTWNNLENGQLEEGNYEDLFLTSDAMILDSISFISEYCYTGKPALFMVRNNTIEKKFNEFGKLAFAQMYKSHSNADVKNFIENTVINGSDPMFNERQEFIRQFLVPKNNKTASENIFNNITNNAIA